MKAEFEIVWRKEVIPTEPSNPYEALLAYGSGIDDSRFKKLGRLMADMIWDRLRSPSVSSAFIKPVKPK